MKNADTFHNRTRLVMVSAGIAFLGIAGQGHASWARAGEPLRMNVSYADLDIDSPAGIKALYGRLRFAAHNVCAPLDDGRHSPGNFRFQGCYRTALDGAVAKINKPTLTAMHSATRQASGG